MFEVDSLRVDTGNPGIDRNLEKFIPVRVFI